MLSCCLCDPSPLTFNLFEMRLWVQLGVYEFHRSGFHVSLPGQYSGWHPVLLGTGRVSLNVLLAQGEAPSCPSSCPSQIYGCHLKLISSLADRHWRLLADWLPDTLRSQESDPEEEWESAPTRGAGGVATRDLARILRYSAGMSHLPAGYCLPEGPVFAGAQ